MDGYSLALRPTEPNDVSPQTKRTQFRPVPNRAERTQLAGVTRRRNKPNPGHQLTAPNEPIGPKFFYGNDFRCSNPKYATRARCADRSQQGASPITKRTQLPGHPHRAERTQLPGWQSHQVQSTDEFFASLGDQLAELTGLEVGSDLLIPEILIAFKELIAELREILSGQVHDSDYKLFNLAPPPLPSADQLADRLATVDQVGWAAGPVLERD